MTFFPTSIKRALAIAMFTLLTACGGGGDDGKGELDDKKTIDAPHCAASGVCS